MTDAKRTEGARGLSDLSVFPVAREFSTMAGDVSMPRQSVCPYNGDAPVSTNQDFRPRDGLDAPSLVELLEMNEETFRRRFEGSPILRARWVGIVRNAAIALGNSRAGEEGRAVKPLGRALRHAQPIVRGHAAWALGNLGGAEAGVLLRGRVASEDDATVRDEIIAAIKEIDNRDAKAKKVGSHAGFTG